jgi:hypothetical protein
MIRILASCWFYGRRSDRRDQRCGSQAHHGAGWVRVVVGCVLMMGLLVGGQIAADNGPPDQTEPPVRLKKKVKPQPEAPGEQRKEQPAPKKAEPAPKPEKPKEDTEPSIQDLEEKIREITNRVAKSLSQAEERLHKNDPGEATQQMQRDIVRDLDELIAQTMRQQQQQSSSSSSSSSSQRQQTRKSGMQRNQAAGNRPLSRPNPQAANANGGNSRGAKRSQEESTKIADLYKDVWGHLPETLRQEMDQYSREQFMAKYGDLLKQYYATIAEKGRRKAEP